MKNKKRERKGRRAQAQIITVVLIILLVLASIVVVWNVVKKTVEESSGQVGTEALMVQLEVKEAGAGAGGGLEVKVKRGSGGGNITSLKFILEDVNGQTYIETISEDLPDELETKTYNVFDLLDEGVEVKKISVVPVVGKKFGIEAEKSIDGVALMTRPVSWWKFDGDFNDSVGGNDGTEYGDAHIEDNVLVLDGVGDYVDVSNLDLGKVNTVSVWLKTSANGVVIGQASDWKYAFRIFNDAIYYQVAPLNNAISNAVALDGEWHFYTVVRNGLNVDFYEDTVSLGSDTLSSDIALSIDAIGKVNTAYFNGTLDDVMIFNKSLSEIEIQKIYCNQGGVAGFC